MGYFTSLTLSLPFCNRFVNRSVSERYFGNPKFIVKNFRLVYFISLGEFWHVHLCTILKKEDMKMNLKYVRLVLLCVGMAFGSLHVQAQSAVNEEPGKKQELPREVPNPEKIAQKETDRLKEALNLTDKQYKKVYKLLLKEQRELFEQRMQRPPMMFGEGPGNGMRPPHEGGMPPMGEGMMPGEGGMHRPPMGAGPKPEKAEDMQKRVEKKNKKMKKILNESQYDQWLGMSRKPAPEPKKK